VDKLGMLALGAFVGGVLSLGLPLTTALATEEFKKIAVFVLGSAFTGPVFTLIGYFGGSQLGDALFAYPIGLCLALLWFYVRMSMENIRSADKTLKWIARLHIAAITIVTLAAIYIFVLPVMLATKLR
jgi:hypothetical protein